MIPGWLHVLSVASLALGFGTAAWIAFDETRYPQYMWIMNLVWPITGLYGSVVALLFYLRHGRSKTHHGRSSMKGVEKTHVSGAVTAKATTHCGAGCTLGDIMAEWLLFLAPALALWLGWNHVYQEKMFAAWILDFVLAFVIGVLFQYFTLVPMRHLPFWRGIVEAVKADALSLTAWQIGMYAFMAFAQFFLFRTLLHVRLEVDTPEFWLMMQIAMLCGFATSYPVNAWLLKHGIKEPM